MLASQESYLPHILLRFIHVHSSKFIALSLGVGLLNIAAASQGSYPGNIPGEFRYM